MVSPEFMPKWPQRDIWKQDPKAGLSRNHIIIVRREEVSRQRKVLPGVLEMVRQHAPDAAVCLAGSVAMGYEVPESDIDILLFVSEVTDLTFPGGEVRHEIEGFKFVEATFQGVPLQILCGTPRWFEDLVVSKPWRGYKFLQFELVHDPEGLIQSWRDQIAPWFDDHPDIVDLYKKWMSEWKRRSMSRGKEQGDLIKKYPEIFDLWKDLDPMFEEQTTAGPRSAGDAKDRAPES